MRLLLDTHLLIWALANSPRLRPEARKLILNEGNALLFSAISIAEVAIKHALGRPDFGFPADEVRYELLANGYTELSLTGSHAEALAKLPPIHKDPFDRLLVAQAIAEGVTLLTGDATVARYPGAVRLV